MQICYERKADELGDEEDPQLIDRNAVRGLNWRGSTTRDQFLHNLVFFSKCDHANKKGPLPCNKKGPPLPPRGVDRLEDLVSPPAFLGTRSRPSRNVANRSQPLSALPADGGGHRGPIRPPSPERVQNEERPPLLLLRARWQTSLVHRTSLPF